LTGYVVKLAAQFVLSLNLAIGNGWLWLHQSGTYVRFTGAELFA
jgi:hypothetical protein